MGRRSEEVVAGGENMLFEGGVDGGGGGGAGLGWSGWGRVQKGVRTRR